MPAVSGRAVSDVCAFVCRRVLSVSFVSACVYWCLIEQRCKAPALEVLQHHQHPHDFLGPAVDAAAGGKMAGDVSQDDVSQDMPDAVSSDALSLATCTRASHGTSCTSSLRATWRILKTLV